MNDKVGIKIDPKQGVIIQIGDTLPDILPLLQGGLTEHKILGNDTETQRKMRLSIRIGVLGKTEQLPCQE